MTTSCRKPSALGTRTSPQAGFVFLWISNRVRRLIFLGDEPAEDSPIRLRRRAVLVTLVLPLLAALTGCSAAAPAAVSAGDRAKPLPPSPYSIKRCQLEVTLQPGTHRIEAAAVLTIALKEPGKGAPAEGLRLQLHRDLGIDSVECDGKPLQFSRLPDAVSRGEETLATSSHDPPPTPTSAPEEAEKPPALYQLDCPALREQPVSLVVRYGGRLFQDVAAGEKPGRIHNLQMRAHIGAQGVFLSEDGAWYPRLPSPPGSVDGPEIELTEFELTVAHPPGMVLAASGNRDGAKLNQPRGLRTTWRSPFPFQGMALVGGPHQVFQQQVNGVLVSVHVSQDHGSFAPGLLSAVESYLKLYEPLIGKYPFVEFTVVENFFSSGFAYPGFTVLASAVIAMGPMGLEPGYLDHEFLHNWWGNGVLVSALDGDWCESLTTYCANYMRHLLEGRENKARAMRRDTCYGLSRLSADKDKPVGRFGRDGGPGQLIGYQKGSMVFAMLARRVGQEVMWRSLRTLARERLGKPTTWDHIRETIERESGQSLKAFFDTWVRGTGIPSIAIEDADYDTRAKRLTLAVSQKERPPTDFMVPVRLGYRDGVADELLALNRSTQVCVIRLLEAPEYVELDPDFHVMRRIPLKDIMPTISGISKTKSLTIVRTEEDFDAFKQAADQIEERYKDAEGTSARYIQADELTAEHLSTGHGLILGKACLAPAAQELLRGQTLSIGEGFFTVGERRYEKATDEVLCCLRNEQDPGGVLCFYHGNSAADLKKARVVAFYGGHSLVVFEDGQAVYRQDFENVEQVKVRVEAE